MFKNEDIRNLFAHFLKERLLPIILGVDEQNHIQSKTKVIKKNKVKISKSNTNTKEKQGKFMNDPWGVPGICKLYTDLGRDETSHFKNIID